MTDPVQLSRRGDVAVVTIANPPVNALSDAVRAGLLDAFETLAGDATLAGVVIEGGSGRFVAGADIREMDRPPAEPSLPRVVAAVAACPHPVVAALDGAALGGGLELALACDRRVASPRATVGLPETRLGLVPGAGGTQRLPRLVGLARAVAMIAEAEALGAAEALAAGLVDAVVEADLLARCVEAAPRTPKRPVAALPVPPADPAALDAAAARAARRGRGAPAVAEAVRLVRLAAETDFAAGLAAERAAFLALRASPEAAALRHAFKAERAAAKPADASVSARARPVERAAVIGAGTMGAGIATALAGAGVRVDLLERDAEAAEAGRRRVADGQAAGVAAGRIGRDAADRRLALIAVGHDWSVLDGVDLVVEAAFEDLGVKRDIFGRLGAATRPGTVLATNTSYLPIAAIAAATARPADVLGLHFFAPADVMRLVEVVETASTGPDALATAMALAKRLGKVAVVARDAEGFIGNRVFSAYRRHAEYLLEDGASPSMIDDAMTDYGFAMGPFAVADLSGLDIAHAMRRRADATRPADQRYVAIPDRLVAAGRLGRKTGGGYYDYPDGRRAASREADALVAAARAERGLAAAAVGPEAVRARLLAVMANEGAKLLAEGVARRGSDIDVALVHGYGFPAAKGGPMYAADRRGLPAVLAEMETAHAAGGAGSEPADLLLELGATGGTLADRVRG